MDMPPPERLADALRRRTRELHARAERSGVVRELLQGRASRAGYALLLRNLEPAYRALEAGLERHRGTPLLGPLARPPLYRAAALAADLAALAGPDWPAALPLLPAGARYFDCVAAAAGGNGERLVAHAYVRYLGDLNGGRVLRPLLQRTLGLPAAALAFYDFPGLGDLEACRREFRDALDRAGAGLTDPAAVIEEAAAAFRLNIAVSEAVREALSLSPAPGG